MTGFLQEIMCNESVCQKMAAGNAMSETNGVTGVGYPNRKPACFAAAISAARGSMKRAETVFKTGLSVFQILFALTQLPIAFDERFFTAFRP